MTGIVALRDGMSRDYGKGGPFLPCTLMILRLTARVAPPTLRTVNVATARFDRVSPDGRACCVAPRTLPRQPGRTDISRRDRETNTGRRGTTRGFCRPVGLPPVDSRRKPVHRWPINIYGYRWYDPLTGRWPSRDPIGDRGGINLYRALNNAPLNSYDDTGLTVVMVNDKISPATDGSDIQIPEIPFAESRWFNVPSLALDDLDLDLDLFPKECGDFSWSTRWQIKPASILGGIIVQHVISTGRVWNCDGVDITPPDLSSNYRELWKVEPNSSLTTIGKGYERHRDGDPRRAWQAGDDRWNERGKGCSKGVVNMLATATFFEGGVQPVNFVPKKNNAGVLPSTRDEPKDDQPPIGGRPSNTIQRELKVTWDCCGKDGHTGKTILERKSFGPLVP